MDHVQIDHLLHRLRMPRRAFDQRARLERILRESVDRFMQPALRRAGVGSDELVCIGRLKVPIRVKLSQPDESIALAWAVSLARSVQIALAQGSGQVVRYRTRHEAVLDAVVSVVRGELTRAWAWRDLGLWPAAPVVASEPPAARIPALLAQAPASVIPVLVALARGGEMQALVRELPARGWAEIARQILRQAGTSDAVGAALFQSATRLENLAANGHISQEQAHESGALDGILPDALGRLSIDAAQVAHVMAASQVARATANVLQTRPEIPIPTIAALALAAIGEVDATLLRSSRLHALLDVLTLRLQPKRPERHTRKPEPPAASRHRPRPSRDGANDWPPVLPVHGEAESEFSGESAFCESSRDALPTNTERGVLLPSPAGVDRKIEGLPPAITQHAGLLFLLHLVRELDLERQFRDCDIAELRSFRWCLHQLARELAPISNHDPAALAFSGLPPDADPPDSDAPPPADEEAALVREFADRIREALRHRLGRPSTESMEKWLDWACRRRGEIVADPGWFQVRFSLDDVSTALRRAGLDLDLGWVDFLGVVVRFVYD